MRTLKLGIIKETKTLPDKRVALTPLQCSELLREYPGLEIYIQPSTIRCYTDAEYTAFGLSIKDDLSHCDVLMGIKEVAIDALIPDKKYLFFSHTIKKQSYNQKMIQAILAKRIELIDYECLTDKENNRIIGFGRYAGIVGAYNGILGYGSKYDLYHLKRAFECRDRAEMEEELKRVKLPNIKIAVTGGGRVANGVTEVLGALKIRKVTPYEFLSCNYREPVYCQLHSKDYHLAKDGSSWNVKDFYSRPDKYVSTFMQYARRCDLLISAHFWNPKAPILFTRDDMRSPEFKITVIADVTCDINGSIPSTLKASSIAAPFYGYNPLSESVDVPFSKDTITVMAVDNLPCELPRDSSEDFGKDLTERVLPSLFREDKDGIIERATITRNGNLTDKYNYLSEYAGFSMINGK